MWSYNNLQLLKKLKSSNFMNLQTEKNKYKVAEKNVQQSN